MIKTKHRIENIHAGIIDCNYTIARLEKDNASKEQIQHWVDYKNDLLKTLSNFRNLNH
jgi:hypothetical protein